MNPLETTRNLSWEEFQKDLRSHGNPSRAISAKKYMRDKFEFLGISSPELKLLTRNFISFTARSEPIEKIHQLVQSCWDQNEREFQYLGCSLLARASNKWTLETFEVGQQLITQKSWWDTVDTLSAHLFGPLLEKFPELLARMDDFSKSENFWERRTSILHQLLSRNRTDFDRLTRYCLASANHPEFFVRKAIGWALRTHARTHPEQVQEFLKTYRESFSSLSVREALKHHPGLYGEIALHFGSNREKPGE